MCKICICDFRLVKHNFACFFIILAHLYLIKKDRTHIILKYEN